MKIDENEFIRLTSFLKQDYGINLTKKKGLIEGRLTNLILDKGFNNFKEYLDYVLNDISKEEITVLINKLTTNYTYFMRETDHFDYFKNIILPYLNDSVKNKDLRIWSAGCSSGEEPYTLAMIMEDYFNKSGILWDKNILATDISVNVLEKAKQGIYTDEEIENIPNNWKLNYFDKTDKYNFEINDKIKQEVVFRIFNLMDDFPFKKKFHVIFCRNVMIYFDKETKKKLINKFYQMTEPGGYLFIGHSESIIREETAYKYVMPSVYRKG